MSHITRCEKAKTYTCVCPCGGALHAALERAARELLTTGSYDTLAGSADFGTFNEMMAR